MKIRALLSILLFGLSMNVFAVSQTECEVNGEMDWNCMCQILCQAGEGGAACNCDGVP
ncbi:hypothetical protein [Kosakonia sp. LAM2021]|uniref:hypothetical protein n=1 Tax=Kosakonia sp. LAM2021 TaxID=2800475 RepID=UPI00190C7C82|nr:hypothetical protein [Kosakonia sp. LAM2021]